VSKASELWSDEAAFRKMSQVASPYGDGESARRTVEALLFEMRGVGSRPSEFLAEAVGLT